MRVDVNVAACLDSHLLKRGLHAPSCKSSDLIWSEVIGSNQVSYTTVPQKARWLVPEMVKNGSYSSFACLRLIWACLVNNSWPR